ncbi:MAG: XRE family transcriptional regulator [Ruminiclostridium sp.]|nr:XRE family transcriptional regulator [Ruminiclostridium sp.]
MNIGDLIHNQRKALHLTLEEVGKAVGVSKSTVKKWETGYISNMKRDKIALLANILQINPTELINDNNKNLQESSNVGNIISRGDNIYRIPVFETVSAGFGAYASNEIIDFIPVLISDPYDVESTIAIKVKGDSMYPKIEDGDVIIVRKQNSVDSGDVAVLLLDNEEGLVKKVMYGKDWIELISINPEYKARRFEKEEILRLRVVGKVVGSYKVF